jgi:hypothetical protein
MDSEHQSSAPSWGARISFSRGDGAQGYPAPRSPDKREKQGLVIWKGDEPRLRLSATQAIALLEHLHADSTWQQDGIVAGEPVTRLVLPKRKGEPVPEPETVLVNQMQLTPRRTEMLARLLEKHEAQLREMSEEEYNERGRALGRAYRLILNYTLSQESEEEPGSTQRGAYRPSGVSG